MLILWQKPCKFFKMAPKEKDQKQGSLFFSLRDTLNPKHVQEKNITYPTDAKLHKKIIQKCKDIAQKEDTELRQSYSQTLKKLSRDQRFRNHPKNKSKALKADKKVKTIAGRLVRESERKLKPNSEYQKNLQLFLQILMQKKDSKNYRTFKDRS